MSPSRSGVGDSSLVRCGARRLGSDPDVGGQLEQIDLLLHDVERVVPDDLSGSQIREGITLGSDCSPLESSEAAIGWGGLRGEGRLLGPQSGLVLLAQDPGGGATV